MAIPTSGAQTSKTHTATATFVANITLVGDAENQVAYNIDGETDVVNRSAKQLANSAKYLYDEKTRANETYNCGTTNALLSAFADDLKYRTINHDVTVNLTAPILLGVPVYIERIDGAGKITLDLDSNTITPIAGLSTVIYIRNCTISEITITTGTIDDSIVDTLSFSIIVEKCNGFIHLDTITSKHAGAFSTHFSIAGSKVHLESATIENGGYGLSASEFSHVLSQSQTTTSNPLYGLNAVTGAVIAKGAGSQFTGSTSNEVEATGGEIR